MTYSISYLLAGKSNLDYQTFELQSYENMAAVILHQQDANALANFETTGIYHAHIDDILIHIWKEN